MLEGVQFAAWVPELEETGFGPLAATSPAGTPHLASTRHRIDPIAHSARPPRLGRHGAWTIDALSMSYLVLAAVVCGKQVGRVTDAVPGLILIA